MIQIIGVKFRKPGKVYYFDPTGFSIEKGDHVIVETARGVEYGAVVLGPKNVTDDQIVQPLKPVIRVATPEDAETCRINEQREKEAFDICLEKIQKHGLEMKLIDSEYTFDRNKLLFYFTADGRIDFRELVKDLASVFHTRIELRQIGVRDETKMIGGIALCGRPLCCHAYLSDFAPVSIKMAKEQNLSLNPAKISGVCGRLMCCLKNEQEAYEHLNRSLPHVGSSVSTPEGYEGEVQSVSVLRQLVKVVITDDSGEKEVKEYHVSELSFDKKNASGKNIPAQALPDEVLDEEDLIALEKLSKPEETVEEESAKPQNNHRGNKPFRKKSGRDSHDNRRNEQWSGDGQQDRGRNNQRSGNGQRPSNRNGQRANTKTNGHRDNNRSDQHNNRNQRFEQGDQHNNNRNQRFEQGDQHNNRNQRFEQGDQHNNRNLRFEQGNREYRRNDHASHNNRDFHHNEYEDFENREARRNDRGPRKYHNRRPRRENREHTKDGE